MDIAGLHILAKPVGPICNLNCKYCFYLEKETLYPQVSQWAMRDDVLEHYIRHYIEDQNASVVTFLWQGGEPTLLGVDYFRRVVELQKQYAGGKRVENAFQTNGVLLDDAWASFFKEHNFLLGVSIDGPRELHDVYRLDKGDRPTFDRVMRGIEILRKHEVEFNTLTTVHSANSKHPIEVYRFLRENGNGYMQFIPIVERVAWGTTKDGLALIAPGSEDQAEVAPWSVEPATYGDFLCTIFDEWVRRDVGRQFVQLFDVTLQIWTGMESSLCVFRRTCGSAPALEHCGDLYSCDHFVYPQNRLGNIMESPLVSLVDSEQQRRFNQSKETSLPKYCRECQVRFACNGECPKHRFLMTPDGENGLNYLCKAYKHFFHHVNPYMRFMAEQLQQELPPANVMQWARQNDLRAAGKVVPNRNDVCSCGSGKKYKKKCCGAV